MTLPPLTISPEANDLKNSFCFPFKGFSVLGNYLHCSVLVGNALVTFDEDSSNLATNNGTKPSEIRFEITASTDRISRLSWFF